MLCMIYSFIADDDDAAAGWPIKSTLHLMKNCLYLSDTARMIYFDGFGHGKVFERSL